MKYLVIISMKETVTVVQNFLYITRWVCHGMLQFVVATVTTVMTFSVVGSNDSSHAVPSLPSTTRQSGNCHQPGSPGFSWPCLSNGNGWNSVGTSAKSITLPRCLKRIEKLSLIIAPTPRRAATGLRRVS